MNSRLFGRRGLLACSMAFSVVLVGLTSHANAQFPQLIPTGLALVRFGGSPATGRMYKLVSKAPRGGPLFQLPSSSPAPTGGSLTVTVGSGTLGCTLAPGLFNGTVGWRELGNPAGSRGYKYLNKNAPTTDPCKVVIVKEKVIKLIALGTGTIATPLDYPPGNPDISTVLTLGGDDYCGYATAPHFRERADRYIKAKDQSAPGSCPPVCDCCSAGFNLLSFETGITIGEPPAGRLSNYRCSNNASGACAVDGDCDYGSCMDPPGQCDGNRSVTCSGNATPCTGTCGEIVAGNLPMDLESGSLYSGGGLNAIPVPWRIPDKGKPHFKVTNCDSETGVLTLGPTTPSEVGKRQCTSGRECSVSGTPCVLDSDCPSGETCNTQCLFGPPLPIPVPGTPPYSYCMIKHIGLDVGGNARCDGGHMDITVPLRWVPYFNGDLFKSSTPPDLPGVQSCPICVPICSGGSNDGLPCRSDNPLGGTSELSDCTGGGGTCPSTSECLGGPNDGLPCTPATSDSAALGDSENMYPTSHDCPNHPLAEEPTLIGWIPITLDLTMGQKVVNAVDLPNSARTFFGFCRDVTGDETFCFEGDPYAWCPAAVPPATGEAVPCDDDSDCDDGDAYESCSQRNPGAFSEGASTRISVSGTGAGVCLADGEAHDSKLVSIFGVPPSFNALVDAYFDLPGPGAVMLQGDMQLE